MDDARLSQILEETMSNMFGPQFMDQLAITSTNQITDLSNTFLSQPTPLLFPTLPTLIPHNERQLIEEPTTVNMNTEQNLNMRKYQILENLSTNWFRNNRDYQDINYQMNKISQHLIQNITSLIDPEPNNRQSLFDPHQQDHWEQHNPFLLDVGGISLPISLQTRRIPIVENDTLLYPNIRQVLAATEIYPHTSNSPELSCPLTLEDFVPGEELCRIRQCRHVFTWKYLQEWFCTNSHCPVCRYDIKNFVAAVPEPVIMTPVP